ncbi:hypothetical protein RN001_003385 [Aquatica leii]|uniref:Regulatory protein zeste n=1 Tax=Aquatica leii TaxID=1421715 RepID=A0AAN7SMA1_9COLE|nr:hypothetical protein RN001_003385 [Aquatica leii]
MEKRERSSNFTESEKELLLNIVTDSFFEVIENKKTDSVTIKKKNETWDLVAVSFNAMTTNIARNGIQLNTAYNNIKRKLKKDKADDKVQIYKTGGGPLKSPKVNDMQDRFLSLLKLQFEPLRRRFDSSRNYIINVTIEERRASGQHCIHFKGKIYSQRENLLYSIVDSPRYTVDTRF